MPALDEPFQADYVYSFGNPVSLIRNFTHIAHHFLELEFLKGIDIRAKYLGDNRMLNMVAATFVLVNTVFEVSYATTFFKQGFNLRHHEITTFEGGLY
jgi:hypothetical protein